MKLLSFLFLMFTISLFAQNPEKLDITDYVVKADFLENKFDEKYLLIGDFLPIKEGSKVKLAKVLTENGWNYIDDKGRKIIESDHLKYSDYTYVSNGIIDVIYTLEDKSGSRRRCFGLLHYKNGLITDRCYQSTSINNINPQSNPVVAVSHIPNEDYFLTAENNEMKIYDFNGKQLIDKSFGNIKIIDQYIITRDEFQNINKEQNYYVYSKQGKLLKTFFGFSLDFYLNQFIFKSNKGYQLLRSDNFMPAIDKYFENISYSNESTKKIFTASDSENNQRYYYFINKKLESVRIPFEEGDEEINYWKKYIIKKNKKNYISTYFIYDLKGNPIGKYPELKYGIISSIALGKIHDKEFMTRHDSEFEEMVKYFAGYDNKQGIGVVKTKKTDEEEKQAFYDRNTGELLFSKFKSFGYLKKYDANLKLLVFSSSLGEIIVNRKGEIIKKLKPQMYSLDYTLYDDISKKIALFNKNFEPASDYYDEIKFLFKWKNKGHYLAKNGDYYGIIDNKGNIVYKFEYSYIYILNPDDDVAEYIVFQKPKGITEPVSIKTLKSFFTIQLKPNTTISKSKDNIFYFNSHENNNYFALDKYGNSVKLPY